MCREGIPVSWTQAEKLRWYNFTQDKMKEVFHDPSTGEPWVEGDTYTRTDLAETMETLARNADLGHKNMDFYTGNLGRQFVSDLAELGGIMTVEDLMDYEVHWSDPVHVQLDSIGATLFSNPPPASGVIMAAILNILDNYDIKPEDDIPLLYHRIAESYKWAYAKRTQLGDSLGDDSIADIVNDLVANITSEKWADNIKQNISGKQSVK